MFGTQDLSMVRRMQDELRREAASNRLAARINRKEPRKEARRRVFGLGFSFA